MPRLTRRVAAGAAAAALMLMAACTNSDPAPTSSTVTSLPTTTSPAVTTVAEAAEERDARLAGQAISTYWARLDELASDPRKSLNGLATVARGQARLQWQRNLTLMRGAGQKQVGAVVVETPVTTYDRAKKVYTVKACVDVSKVNVVDKKGKSVISANRRPRVRYAYQVTRASDGFYVTQDLMRGVPC